MNDYFQNGQIIGRECERRESTERTNVYEHTFLNVYACYMC